VRLSEGAEGSVEPVGSNDAVLVSSPVLPMDENPWPEPSVTLVEGREEGPLALPDGRTDEEED